MKQLFFLMQGMGISSASQFFNVVYRPIDRNNIEPTVIIVVKKEGSKTRVGNAWGGHPGLDTAILKIAVTTIHEQGAFFSREMGEKDVVGSIAIEVGDVHPHSGFRNPIRVDRCASERGLIFEGAVLLIDPELIRVAVVCDIKVWPRVPVEVNGHHA